MSATANSPQAAPLAPTAPHRLTPRAVMRLAFLGLVWGTSFLWIALALPTMSPGALSAARMIAAAVTLVLLALVGRRGVPARRLIPHLAVIGFLGIAFPYTLFPLAQQTISSALSGSLNATTPAWTLVLTWIFVRDGKRPNRAGVVGIGLGLLGILIMLKPWDSAGTLGGSLLALLGAASYGASNVYATKHVVGRADALSITTIQLIWAAFFSLCALPIAPVTWHPTGLAWVAVAWLGILGGGIAQVIYMKMIAEDGAVVASTVTYLNPVVAIVAGALVLHETIAISTLIGIVVTLVGIVITRRH